MQCLAPMGADGTAGHPITWSILARDADGGFGTAIASKFLAVGALCRHSWRDAITLATHARMNPLYGAAGLSLRPQGLDAQP